MKIHARRTAACVAPIFALTLVLFPAGAFSQNLYVEHVHGSIDLGRKFLAACQQEDGAYPADGLLVQRGTATAAATLALLKSGAPASGPAMRSSLQFLRGSNPGELCFVNELSLRIMVFATVDAEEDRPRLQALVARLLEAQRATGAWPHDVREQNGDMSSSEFAMLALRDAVKVGVPVPAEVWNRASAYWISTQLPDGGWPKFHNEADPVTGDAVSSISGTFAGVAALSLCEQYGKDSQGSEDCCQSPASFTALVRGIDWLAKSCGTAGIESDPAVDHLYGIERAGRLQGEFFPGEEAWFRRGAISLMLRQHRSRGYWVGNHLPLATSYALLYLASGTAHSVINELTPFEGSGELLKVRRPHAVWNLTELFSYALKQPRTTRAQQVDLSMFRGVDPNEPLFAAPILFLTGTEVPSFSMSEMDVLKEYLTQGGLLLAAPSCPGDQFESSLREFAAQLVAPLDGQLQRMPPHHRVFHSRYQLPPDDLELWELNSGCRTVLIYVPYDLGCHWEQAISPALDGLEERNDPAARALKLGLNILEIAAKSHVDAKLRSSNIADSRSAELQPDRGLIRLGLVRSGTSWNVAPRSMAHALHVVNESVGSLFASQPVPVRLGDKHLFQHPVLYWHGAERIALTPQEQAALRFHLKQGGVLLADACCHSAAFDQSFQQTIKMLFPELSWERIPATHPLMGSGTAFDLSRLPLHKRESATPERIEAAPILYGLNLAGRYAVVYSPFDLSCALDSEVETDCTGYARDDAAKIVTNLLIYSLQQDVKKTPSVR